MLKYSVLATPLVAGEIANLLLTDNVPIDRSTGKLAKSVRDYMKSGTNSGWNRRGSIRMLWNGVTEANNPKKAATVTNKKTCNGLDANKYVSRDVLRSIIEDQFCPDAVKQGGLDKNSASIMRRYNKDTMEEVVVAIDFAPGLNFKPNKDDCVRYLLGDITDACDANNNTNHYNYKGGGFEKVGPVGYRVEPQTVRAGSYIGPSGRCEGSVHILWDEFTVRGTGFAGDDWGKGLNRQLANHCALLPGTWHFDYGLVSGGWEWTAKFRTTLLMNGCVEARLKDASKFAFFQCTGDAV